MTIEEIRKALDDYMMPGPKIANIIDSIVAIRSAAYDEGWTDGNIEGNTEPQA